MSDTLGDALPREMTRVRDEVLPIYAKFPTGAFAVAMMRIDLDAAQKAIVESDVAEMARVYSRLKGWSL